MIKDGGPAMMTREEAIELLCHGDWLNVISEHIGKQDTERIAKAMCIVGKALRPVNREQAMKVWKGEWIWDTSGLYPKPVCSKCGEEPYRRSNHTSDLPNYCPKCGAPMTDEAVDITLKRLEAMKDETD